MDSKLTEIFKDEKLCRKIQKRFTSLPFFLQKLAPLLSLIYLRMGDPLQNIYFNAQPSVVI